MESENVREGEIASPRRGCSQGQLWRPREAFPHARDDALIFDSGWAVLSHAAAETKWADLGILDPIATESTTSQMYTKRGRRGRCLSGEGVEG